MFRARSRSRRESAAVYLSIELNDLAGPPPSEGGEGRGASYLPMHRTVRCNCEALETSPVPICTRRVGGVNASAATTAAPIRRGTSISFNSSRLRITSRVLNTNQAVYCRAGRLHLHHPPPLHKTPVADLWTDGRTDLQAYHSLSGAVSSSN